MKETIPSISPILAISCPVLAAILIPIFSRRPNIREAWTILASVAQFLFTVSMAPLIARGGTLECSMLNDVLVKVPLAFRVDALGFIFAMTSSFLWILVSIYSIGYMRTLNEHAQTRYYFCFALAIMGAEGVAFSGNLITMYVFYEILTISTYPLVAHDESSEALFAGRKYLAYLLTSGVFLLAAIVFDYSIAGTTDFVVGGHLTSHSTSRAFLSIIFIFFILGFAKAAYMPFHSWLPTAMVAPTPVSALLHAVAVVKAGVFGIIRMAVYVFGTDTIRELGFSPYLASLALFTMIAASLFAISQDNLKKRLAYSTISQLSYIIFGVATLSPSGIAGAILHIPFHGLMKITLFLCAGSILVSTGKKNVSEMSGIGHQMPFTMASFAVGALGMCGIPPTVGFVSKWYLGLAAVQSGNPFFLPLLLISSFLDAIYFLPILYTAFFATNNLNENTGVQIREAPPSLIIPSGLTAFLSLLLFFPNPLSNSIFRIVTVALSQ